MKHKQIYKQSPGADIRGRGGARSDGNLRERVRESSAGEKTGRQVPRNVSDGETIGPEVKLEKLPSERKLRIWWLN